MVRQMSRHYNLLEIAVKKTRFFCNGMRRFRIEIIVAPVVTKSSNTIMLLTFGGSAPKVNTAPTRCLEWHSAISSYKGMPRSEPKRAEISDAKLRSLWRRLGEVTMHQSLLMSASVRP